MIEYKENGKFAIVDGLKFTRDSNTGYYLCSRKVGGVRKRLHVYMWEKFNGSVPSGFHVHHIDGDKRNNDIENLEVMMASDHEKLHGESWDETRKSQARENLLKNAVPKAAEWHKSQKGIEWHKENGLRSWENRGYHKRVCENCGKEYETRHAGKSKYCSNACKSSARRKSGVDNETRKCEWCGKVFTANRYSKTSTCSASCRSRLYWHKKHNKSR